MQNNNYFTLVENHSNPSLMISNNFLNNNNSFFKGESVVNQSNCTNENKDSPVKCWADFSFKRGE